MLNEKVKHIKFGEGTISDISDAGRISVSFKGTEEEKVFQYPNGFKNFLKFEDNSLQEKALEDLEESTKQKQMEKEKSRLEFEAKFEEEKNIRLELEKEKRKEKRLLSNKKKLLANS